MRFIIMRKFLGLAAAGLFVSGTALASGIGLSGAYYQFSSDPEPLSNAESMIASSSGPAATFIATTVCFPSCGGTLGDGNNLAAFLGGNAINLSPNSITDLSDHAMVLTGYLYAPTTGTYSFTLGSDDGSALWINNALVINDDGDHSFTSVTNNSVSLTAGLNSIKVLQIEVGGVTGLSLSENGAALATANLYPVPLPESWTLMLGGVAGLFLFSRSRKRQLV
jgi:hypothetical protein